MPSVFVGQDCKYDRNFEALPLKEYLTQVLAKSYGAPEGSCAMRTSRKVLESQPLAVVERLTQLLYSRSPPRRWTFRE